MNMTKERPYLFDTTRSSPSTRSREAREDGQTRESVAQARN